MSSLPKILIVSLYSSPGMQVGGKRFTFLSRIFQEHFAETHVLTIEEKYFSSKDFSLPPVENAHRTKIWPSYPVIGVREGDSVVKRGFRRLWHRACLLDTFSGWIAPALFEGARIIKKVGINVIIATGPPFTSMVIGLLLSRLANIRLVLDYRDPWMVLPLDVGVARVKRALEKMTIRRASGIVFCSEIMKDDFERVYEGQTTAPLWVIHNGYAERVVDPCRFDEEGIHMVYAGEIYGQRRIRTVAPAIFTLLREGVIDESSFHFHLFSTLSIDDWDAIKEFGLEKVVCVHEKVPYDQVVSFMKGADILWLQSGDEVVYQIPYKFYDYLSVKRPIFTIAPEGSGMEGMMRNIDCGEFAPIHNDEAIANALRKMIQDKPVYTFRGAEEYTWEKVGLKYVEAINKLAEYWPKRD